MRRLASVLVVSSKRSDKSDASPFSSSDDSSRYRLVHKKSKVFPSLSRKHLSSLDPPSLPPLVASDLANSSSSSSSGSTTLRTPDDDGLPRTSGKKGSWKSWLGGKNVPVDDHSEDHLPSLWQSSKGIPCPPKAGSNEADDASSQFDDPYSNPDDILTSSHSVQQATTARANARIMIMNSLVHEPALPPLLQQSNAISFPTSCHNPRRLRRRETLESKLHKKSLLCRLDHLSSSAELSIAPLASKQFSLKPQARNFQDDMFPSANAVNLHSSCLESWVSRPCFEDRLQLWTRSDFGDVIRTRIPGSLLGVAALEFSETLELLAGTLVEGGQDLVVPESVQLSLASNSDPSATQMKGSGSQACSLQPQDSLVKPLSAQPNGITPVSPKALSPAQPPDGSTTSGFAATNDPIPKRGVRFADDDGKDDQIPLGYVLRIRKNKEQKAQFLREERERRERVAQLSVENRRESVSPPKDRVPRVAAPRQRPSRPLISLSEPSTNKPPEPRQPATVSRVVSEEERIRREVERIEMEKLRRSREQSRKQAEEWERAYNEELQVTRARRDVSHAGRPRESASLSPRVVDRDRSASRDSMYASPGRSNIPHKQTPELVFSPVPPHDGSPSSSTPATPGSQYSLSRPPSVYSAHTASSEDVRGRDGKRVSRRMSVVSDSGKGMLLHPPHDHRTSFNPYTWAGVPPVPPMPVAPMANGMPYCGIDIPLLPPTPPFMMNQFGTRSHSYTGLAGQHTSLVASASLPKTYSSERVNGSGRNSNPYFSGSHQRHPSDEVARGAKMLGDPRPGSYDVRGSKTSGFMHVAPPQSKHQRSSWLPPEYSSTKVSSVRPVSGTYPPGAPAPVRRRTAAS